LDGPKTKSLSALQLVVMAACQSENLNIPSIMKYKNLALIASAFVAAATASAQNISSSFVNLDFDSGGTHIASGFDAPGADIIGWNNQAGILDAGVEGVGAWWGPYDFQAAFINGGGSAYNLSDYTIQAGDEFSIQFYAQCWQWLGVGQWTATLFYDNPANVIGSYVTPDLAPHTQWTLYSTPTPIAATAGSVGGKLGILMASTGGAIAQFDEVAISVVPEPTTISLMALAGFGLLLNRRRGVK
jgi:hypothetical protein